MAPYLRLEGIFSIVLQNSSDNSFSVKRSGSYEIVCGESDLVSRPVTHVAPLRMRSVIPDPLPVLLVLPPSTIVRAVRMADFPPVLMYSQR
jgi:hypothetical protein